MPQAKLGQKHRLGDLLVAQGLITEEHLAHALAQQKSTNDRLDSILVRLNLINEGSLAGRD